jgi:outer membrane lipoprotein-sorting protein
MKTLFLTSVLLLSAIISRAQTADELLNQLVSKLEKVSDYSANVLIKADIPLIKILPSKAKIYFKSPDKFKVVSKGIAILPKQGFTDMNIFLSQPDEYMVVLAGDKLIEGKQTKLLTVIANSSESDIILLKLWVDPIDLLIMAAEVTTRSSGNVKVSYQYADQKQFGLPSAIEFKVNVKEFKMPKSIASNPHRKASNKTEKRKMGTISLELSDYKVNQGIADSFFVK